MPIDFTKLPSASWTSGTSNTSDPRANLIKLGIIKAPESTSDNYFKLDNSPDTDFLADTWKLATNVGKWVANMGIGLYNTIMHPIDTLTDLWEGAINTGKSIVQWAEKFSWAWMNLADKAVYGGLNAITGQEQKPSDIPWIFTEWTPANQSVGADITQWVSGVLWASQGLFPVASTVFNAWANTEVGKQALAPVMGLSQTVTDLAKEVPIVSDFYKWLAPERQQDFDSILNNAIQFGATKWLAWTKPVENLQNKVNELPWKAMEVAKEVPWAVAKLPWKAKEWAINLANKSADDLILQAVNPTKIENKMILKERVDQVKDYLKDTPDNSLESVKTRIDTDNAKALEWMKNYEETVGVKWTVRTEPIIQKLKAKYMEKVWDSFVNQDGANMAQQMISILEWFGKEVKDADIVKIRRAFDDVEAKNKGFMQSADANIKWEVYGEANKFFREEIHKSNPEYSKYLKDYSKTKTLSDVLGASIDRKVWQSGGGWIRRGLENTARVTGAWLWGLPGYLIAEWLNQWVKMATSPNAKLTVSKLLSKTKKNDNSTRNPDSSSINSNWTVQSSWLNKPLALPLPRAMPEWTTLPRSDIVAESMRNTNSKRPWTKKSKNK